MGRFLNCFIKGYKTNIMYTLCCCRAKNVTVMGLFLCWCFCLQVANERLSFREFLFSIIAPDPRIACGGWEVGVEVAVGVS
jgi:hypothetical protein